MNCIIKCFCFFFFATLYPTFCFCVLRRDRGGDGMGGLLRHGFFSVTTCFRFVFCFGICSLIRRRGPAFRLFFTFFPFRYSHKSTTQQHKKAQKYDIRHKKQTNPHTANGWAVPVAPEEWCREYPHKGKEEEQQQKKTTLRRQTP